MRLIAVLLVLALSGCSMAQLRQEFVGLCISDVKKSKTRQTQQYDLSNGECLAGIRDVLKDMKAIMRENKKRHFIVADNFQNAFKSCINTTQVGILVTAWEKDKTQIDIASGNADLAAFVSKKVSEKLKPGKTVQEKEARPAVK